MTEHEVIDFLEDEINGLKEQRDGALGEIAEKVFWAINGKERMATLRTIIGFITELKQYREIGTVKECRELASIVNKVERNELAKIIDEWINYSKIGTVEECREAMGKQKPKKPVLRNDNGKLRKSCPVCGCFFSPLSRSCPYCGQAIS